MSLKSADALAILTAAFAAADDMGVSITVVVVDAGARELVSARMDGAGWFTPSIARSKAMTAATMGSDSGDLADLIERHPELESLIGNQMPVQFTTLKGAIAVRRDGQLLGAVGVSGATSDQDVDIARAAVAAAIPSPTAG